MPFLFFATLSAQKIPVIKGRVNPRLPQIEIRLIDSDGDANHEQDIDRIEVWRGANLLQAIDYTDSETPLFLGQNKITFQDMDCDGNKDLLISLFTGAHGDTWYDLYLYKPKTGAFEKYPPFSEESFKSVDCKTKTVRTYVNDGAAGCAYTAGVYRWRNGELEPVRIESQEFYPDFKSFIRRISTFPKGEEEDRRFMFEENGDCHRPTPKNLKPTPPVPSR